MTTALPFDADVALIGYGPSGVTAANALGHLGVSVVAFERDEAIYPRARAVTVNDWTLRCFQSFGLDREVERDLDPTVALRWITYDGRELNRSAFPRPLAGEFAASYAIYQPRMEQTLRDGARRFEHVAVHYGCEVQSVQQDDDGVTVTARRAADGAMVSRRVRYALACDGGASPTRGQIGARLMGDTMPTRWVVIDAKVKRWWPDRHILTFWSDRKRPVVDIALAGDNHRWEFPLGPDESDADFQTHDQLWALLNSLNVQREHVDIHQHAFYRHHVRMADRWRVGRVFLLGDAAHLMPPWAGSGMQSGIRDAVNLCWKLKAVLDGHLPDTVLDSYQAEREPNVQYFTQVSLQLGRLIKMELSPEELAALAASRDGPSPLLALPFYPGGWVRGRTKPSSAVGEMLPQLRVCAANGRLHRLDDLLGDGFALLGDGDAPGTWLSDDERAGWDRLGARHFTVRPPDQPGGGPDDLIDIDGRLLPWLRQYGTRAVAVRPDRFVAAAQGSGLGVPA